MPSRKAPASDPEPEVRYLGDLRRLVVKPGDRFVLRVPGRMTPEQLTRLGARWREVFGDEHPLVVLEEGMELGVVGTAVDDAA